MENFPAERRLCCHSRSTPSLPGWLERRPAGNADLSVKTKTFAVLLAGSMLWCLSILAGPITGSSAIYSFFAMICHQDPSRSWHLAGEPLPVCIRCTSIYFGFLAALWLTLSAENTMVARSLASDGLRIRVRPSATGRRTP